MQRFDARAALLSSASLAHLAVNLPHARWNAFNTNAICYTDNGMDASPFAKLPAELRNRIYGYALQSPQPLELWGAGERVLMHSSARAKHSLALTMTCKTIRAESHLLFFAINDFMFDGTLPSLEQDFLKFRSTIGQQAAASLGHVTLEARRIFTAYAPKPIFVRGVEAEAALHRLRTFALEHPKCKVSLQVPDIDALGPVSVDISDLLDSWNTAFDRFRDQAPGFLSAHRVVYKNAASVFEYWRSVLEQVTDPVELVSE